MTQAALLVFCMSACENTLDFFISDQLINTLTLLVPSYFGLQIPKRGRILPSNIKKIKKVIRINNLQCLCILWPKLDQMLRHRLLKLSKMYLEQYFITSTSSASYTELKKKLKIQVGPTKKLFT